MSVRSFTSIQDLLNNYSNGYCLFVCLFGFFFVLFCFFCFFAVFKKSSSTIQTDLILRQIAHVKQFFMRQMLRNHEG